MSDAYSWTQANVTTITSSSSAWALLKMALWLFPSAYFTKSSLKELKIAFSFHCEIKQFSHAYAYVNAASVKQFWSLNTHIHSCQNVIATVHKIILLRSGAFPKVPQTEDKVMASCPLQKLQSQLCKEVSRAMHVCEVVTLGILPHNSVSE